MLTSKIFQTISAEKLKAFSVGNMNSVRQKSSISKKKEELEERKRVITHFLHYILINYYLVNEMIFQKIFHF